MQPAISVRVCWVVFIGALVHWFQRVLEDSPGSGVASNAQDVSCLPSLLLNRLDYCSASGGLVVAEHL
jgi:hypothetical protein